MRQGLAPDGKTLRSTPEYPSTPDIQRAKGGTDKAPDRFRRVGRRALGLRREENRVRQPHRRRRRGPPRPRPRSCPARSTSRPSPRSRPCGRSIRGRGASSRSVPTARRSPTRRRSRSRSRRQVAARSPGPSSRPRPSRRAGDLISAIRARHAEDDDQARNGAPPWVRWSTACLRRRSRSRFTFWNCWLVWCRRWCLRC